MSMRDNVYADADGIRRTLADKGVTWASEETIASWGWTLVDKDYQAPVSAETIRKQQYDSINTEGVAKRNALLTARAALVASGNSTVNIDTAIAKCLTDWKAALVAVE